MCLAIVTKPESKLSDIENSIRLAWDSNPHGSGFAYANDGAVEIESGFMTVDALIERLNVAFVEYSSSSSFLIHLRFTSAGETGIDNCHPFKVGNYAMIHNGTVNKFVIAKDKKSDTAYMAEYLSKLPDGWVDNIGYIELVEDMIGTSKVALLDKYGAAVILNDSMWIEDKNILYSNNYFKGEKRATQTNISFTETTEYCAYCPEFGKNNSALCKMCLEWR